MNSDFLATPLAGWLAAAALLSLGFWTVSVLTADTGPAGWADDAIARWADETGYDLLDVLPGGSRGRLMVAREFAHYAAVGEVRRVVVRTPEDGVRTGWAFVAGHPVTAPIDHGFAAPAEFVDVVWDG